ncbi:biotin synthase BioB [Leptospira sp. GIMC2001]|uniref:biotin synthase BioB n=1 Tax=Leptospira sp. GIMC2001 TaxID=1513297 RepID=UPI00234A4308|nr:biotin synthase BioB [Leptospira sp. GIMC2001]WCL50373.1 biotin synthase BioB [Leptospira sp. GIMC2001]
MIATTIDSLINQEEALEILDGSVPLLEVIQKASKPRTEFFGKQVRIHILDNIKNGFCPEDCGYCAQRKNGDSGIKEYPLKSEEEIFNDAKVAKENGAYRFCMVTSGTGPGDRSIQKLSSTIRRITDELDMKVCLSAGILDNEKAKILKDAGLDRYNHNLNTAESHYGEICTTHTYQDRVSTLESANQAGIGLCSGVIVGMGESFKDIVNVAIELKRLDVKSIPVNFFIPVKGHAIKNPSNLTPELCLRILAVFRLINPNAEIRMAAGREGHLRSLESMGLFIANSLFASGYLNVKGSEISNTLQLIQDAGMEPEFADGVPESWQSSLVTEHPYEAKNFPDLYKFQKNPLPN